MNGIHDMGGLHGFGPVEKEHNEPVFHARWESRVYAMTQVLDTTGIWSLDEHRHEIELMDAAAYLTVGYYGRWLFAMERILNRKNILIKDEVEKRIEEYLNDSMTRTPISSKRNRNWPLAPDKKIKWGAWRKDIAVTPIYERGDLVRVRNIHPPGHTRVTAYTRGKVGVIHLVNAQAWIFPDTRAHERGENPQAVYNVRFEARELWGEQAEANTYTHIDLSESHLEPA